MPAPRMVIVAGSPGGGKNPLFAVKHMRVDAWNDNDYRAQWNSSRLGPLEPAYTDIPKEISTAAGRSTERFIEDHIAARKSLAFETMLRTDITFEQARKAINSDQL